MNQFRLVSVPGIRPSISAVWRAPPGRLVSPLSFILAATAAFGLALPSAAFAIDFEIHLLPILKQK